MKTVRVSAGKPQPSERGSEEWAKAALHRIWPLQVGMAGKLILVGLVMMEMRGGPVRFGDIIEFSEMPVSTVKRTLESLRRRGLVEHEYKPVLWERHALWRLR